MINTLYLPEIREALAENNTAELREFCTALHPARTAEFMEGLTAGEDWRVLQFAEPPLRGQIFSFFDHDKQVEILQREDRQQVAELLVHLSPDDRVDVLHDVPEPVVQELLSLLPAEVRRDILRLQSYPEGTAGAVMTTDIARLSESLTVREALSELAQQAARLETIYYLYIVDAKDHLRGVVSARQLVSAMVRPETKLSELMATDVAAVNVLDDQEAVAQKVAHFNLLAIPVVDNERRLLGIITHDDVIDVVREEATEDAHRIAGVQPLDHSYLKTSLLTLARKRGMWLTILFMTALLTPLALKNHEKRLEDWKWLVLFIPLVISAGGNSGSQSATLIITALATGDVSRGDWHQVVRREIIMGGVLGGFLGLIGYLMSLVFVDPKSALVIPVTLLCVVAFGTLIGAVLPLIFERLGLDPALMSNPFVTGIVDIVGILIYMNVALTLLPLLT